MNALKMNFTLLELSLALVVLAFMLCAGCGANLQTAFEGTYVNSAKSEFSIAEDTLVLEKQAGEDYRITRKTGIRMLDENGNPGKPILETEVWKAVYDPDRKLLTEQQKGRLIRTSADGLLLENSLYRPIP